MAVDDAARRNGARGQPLQNIGVIDGQRAPGMHRRRQVGVDFIRQERRRVRGRIEINALGLDQHSIE